MAEGGSKPDNLVDLQKYGMIKMLKDLFGEENVKVKNGQGEADVVVTGEQAAPKHEDFKVLEFKKRDTDPDPSELI